MKLARFSDQAHAALSQALAEAEGKPPLLVAAQQSVDDAKGPPFEIVHERSDGFWTAKVVLPGGAGETTSTAADGDQAERGAKMAVLFRLAEMVGAGDRVPPEVEALFSRRLA